MPRKNIFSGADDVYLTDKSIAVRKYSTWIDRNGKHRYSDKTKYYPKTTANLKKAKAVFGFLRKGR